MPDPAFVSRETPFVKFKPRRPDQCSVCRRRFESTGHAYKPAKNTGGYLMSARICAGCGDPLAKPG